MEHRSHAKSVLRKVAITAALGAGTYLLTTLSKQPSIWALTITVFIGGVSLVIQFLVDFEQRLERFEDHDEARFARISTATDLFHRAEAAELDTGEAVIAMIKLMNTVGRKHQGIVTAFIAYELSAMTGTLTQLSDAGLASRHAGDGDWLFSLTDCARHTIDATSAFGTPDSDLVDIGYWKTSEASEYLTQQQRAIQRGVRIRRIFIALTADVVTNNDLLSDFREAIANNAAYGIDVRWLGQIPSDPRRKNVDFVIYDAQLSCEFPFRDNRSQLMVDKSHVAHRCTLFDTWWELALPLDQLPAPSASDTPSR